MSRENFTPRKNSLDVFPEAENLSYVKLWNLLEVGNIHFLFIFQFSAFLPFLKNIFSFCNNFIYKRLMFLLSLKIN